MIAHATTPTQMALHEARKARQARQAQMARRVQSNDNRRLSAISAAANAYPEPTVSREAPNHHVKLYRAWLAITGADMQPMEYIRALCWMMGTTLEEIRLSRQRGRLLPIKKAIIRSAHSRFKGILSSKRLGEIFGCDHTVILYHIGRTERGRYAGTKPNMGTKSGYRVPEEKRAAIYSAWKRTGATRTKIGKDFGVSEKTVAVIIREYTKLMEGME